MHYPFEVPAIEDDASLQNRSYPAKKLDMTGITLPTELVPNWKEEAINIFAELLEHQKDLRVFMDSCVRCGNCAAACQFFLGTGDPKNMPVARAELLRKVYRKYFTAAGKLFPNAENAVELIEDQIKQVKTLRRDIDKTIQSLKSLTPYRPRSISITKLQEAVMWLGMDLKRIHEELGIGSNPYPSSKDPSTTKIEPTADGLKL